MTSLLTNSLNICTIVRKVVDMMMYKISDSRIPSKISIAILAVEETIKYTKKVPVNVQQYD